MQKYNARNAMHKHHHKTNDKNEAVKARGRDSNIKIKECTKCKLNSNIDQSKNHEFEIPRQGRENTRP